MPEHVNVEVPINHEDSGNHSQRVSHVEEHEAEYLTSIYFSLPLNLNLGPQHVLNCEFSLKGHAFPY
jgi:hypothetical protein